MSKVIAVLALSFAGITAAQAFAHPPPSWWASHEHGKDYTPPHSTAVPEIDPASAFSGLTLLIGGLAVIRGRRNKS